MRFPAPDVGVARFPGPDIRAARFPGIDEVSVAFPPAPALVVRVFTETVVDIISTGVVIGVPWHVTETVVDVVSAATVSVSVTVDTESVVDVVSEPVHVVDVVTSETVVDIVSGTTVKPSPTVNTATVVDVASTSSVKPSPTIHAETVIDIASTAVIIPSPTTAGETIIDIIPASTVLPSPTITTNTVVDIVSEGLVELPGVTWFDDLNRASLGSDWGVYSPLPVISGSTKMQAGAPSFNQAFTCFPMYSQSTLTDNMSVKITLAAPTGTLNTNGACAVGGYLRATGTANSGTMVAFQAYGTSVAILSKSGSTFTQRATGTTTTVSATDQYELQADENVYTVYKNGVATNCSWTDVGNLMTIGASNHRGGAIVMSANNANTSYAAQYSMAIDEFTLKDI